MKRFRLIFILAVVSAAMVCLTVSCKPTEEVKKTSVLIYIAGNNSLSYYASDCMDQLIQGYIPSDGVNSDVLLVYYHDYSTTPKLIKVSKTDKGVIRQTTLCTYPSDQKSARKETLSQVLRDAEALCPATYHHLVLWSHSTGFLPEGYYEKLTSGTDLSSADGRLNPSLKRTFGKDDDSSEEITIGDLADVLPFKYESIFFDSCLMGTIEVAYELRDKCNYLVVSPTEIMSQGMPYYMMMYELFNNQDREQAVINVATEYYDYYNHVSDYPYATVTVVRTAELEPLAAFCATAFKKYSHSLGTLNPGALQVFDRCRKHWLFDMGDIMSHILPASSYMEYSLLLQQATAYKANTPKFINIDIKKYSGFGMYLPNPEYGILNDYYRTIAWNKATGLVGY